MLSSVKPVSDSTLGTVNPKHWDPDPAIYHGLHYSQTAPPFQETQCQNKEAFANQGTLPDSPSISMLHLVADSTIDRIERKADGRWVKEFVLGLIAASEGEQPKNNNSTGSDR